MEFAEIPVVGTDCCVGGEAADYGSAVVGVSSNGIVLVCHPNFVNVLLDKSALGFGCVCVCFVLLQMDWYLSAK